MSALNTTVPADIDPTWIGLLDGKMSGWLQTDTDELFRGFPVSASDTVLDVGCGGGFSALFCGSRGASITAVDISAEAVATLTQKLQEQGKARHIEGVVSDSDPLPVSDQWASRVVCQEVLEHVADPRRVVDELVRAGQPGALYLLSVPGELSETVQKAFAPADYYEHPNHIRIFSQASFVDLAESAGLDIIEYCPTGFFWAMWTSLHWAITGTKARTTGSSYSASHDPFSPPYDESLRDWALLWNKLIATPEGKAFKAEMDKVMPKTQVIIARKPG
ncbi:MAG: class I SAM-dependent methyltransferase [Gammaproteobacteria bacterium]|nr:class I SAM-dependent methyltransferase [Gammaproteobacteria bacterium]